MKNLERALLSICVIGVLALYVQAQVINPNYRYCFSFSWLGPKFNNESIFHNATCDDITELSNNIPCRHPLVVTEDGTFPDMEHLWENYDAHITCLLVDSEDCVSYTYRFDGVVQNVTYMCSKVVADNDQSIRSGCYTDVRGNRETEVCICRSMPGGKPCNSSTTNTTSLVLMIFMFIFLNRGDIINFINSR